MLNTSVRNIKDNITTISIHPNPFYDEVVIQFNTSKPEPVMLKVYNSSGQVMTESNLGMTSEGLNYATFNGSKFPSGYYTIELIGKSRSVGKAVIKVN